MNFVNAILSVSAVITSLGVICGLFLVIYKAIRTYKKIDRLDKENGIIIETELAICDGLTQLGANGAVSEARKKLSNYLINNRGDK